MKGFTLIELLVVVLIVGILSALAIPRYAKTIETAKAQDAAASLKLIGEANRLFQIDNKCYATGLVPDASNCPVPTPQSPCDPECGSSPDGCTLTKCEYLSRQAWSKKAYDFELKDGTTNADACGCPSGFYVACAVRTDDGNVKPPYATWGYAYSVDGELVPCTETTPKLD